MGLLVQPGQGCAGCRQQVVITGPLLLRQEKAKTVKSPNEVVSWSEVLKSN